MTKPSLRRRLAIHVAAAALGVVAALLSARGARTAPAAAEPAFWATDRDAGRLVGLDRHLLVSARLSLKGALLVAGRPGGELWAVATEGADPIGAHRLVRLDAAGNVLAEARFGPLVDLTTAGAGQALVVELGAAPGDPATVWKVGPAGLRRAVAREPGIWAVAARGESVLVASAGGRLALLDTAGPVTLVADFDWGGEVGDLAPGPGGGWWALDVTGGGRVGLFDARLAPRWSRDTGLSALHLAPVPGDEEVWVVSTVAPRARRYGPGGVLAADVGHLPLSGLDRALGLAGGGALLVAPGALVELDRRGAPRGSQGGFDFLVDVAAAGLSPGSAGG